MKSIKKQISKNRIKITISIEPEKMEEYFEKNYKILAPTVNLPGFRKGKAPRKMAIESIGHGRLSQGAVQDAISEAYQQVLVEYSLNPVTPPNVTVSKHPSFVPEGGQNELEFDVEFDILPEARLGNYKKLKVTKIDESKLVVTDEEVDKVVDYLANQASTLKEIDRLAKTGDWAQISFKGSQDHVEKEKLCSTSFPFVLGQTSFIPGFEQEIVGMKKGEQKEFDVTFPKDFQDKEIAGKKAHFALTLEDLKEIILPKIDTEFAQKFGRKNPKDLKEAIKKSLEGEKMDREKGQQKNQIADQLVKIVKVDVPSALIEQEKQRMKGALEQDLQKQGGTIDKYMENLKLTPEKMEKDLLEQAKRNIELGVALGEVAKAEKIAISSQESTNQVFEKLIELNSK